MQIRVKWQGKLAFTGISGTGHEITIDGPPESGGEDQGARPMELLLIGMGACSSVDVIGILKKSRLEVTDCQVEVSGERAQEHPKIFTKIHLHFVISGQGLNDKIVSRAISLSAEKYCSASIMLGAMAEVTHDYEIIEASA